MAKYKITTSAMVFYTYEIEAENEETAEKLISSNLFIDEYQEDEETVVSIEVTP
jgi:hypothetical protein